MKILTVSDRVEPLLLDPAHAEGLTGIDLILSCGDLPPEYLISLNRKLDTPLFYVQGNHDIRYKSRPPEGCTDIHAKTVRFHGLNLLGLGGSRWYNGGPNQLSEKEMRRTIRGLRTKIWLQGGIDIVITHAPPRHIHDGEDRCHKGFDTFRWIIDKYSPSHFIHGHIHAFFEDPSDRITVVHETKVINSYGHFVFETPIHDISE